MTDDQLKKGSTQALILAVLSRDSLHGYAIAREIERCSADALRLNEGTLYPALKALERQGFVTGRWEPQPSGPARRVYSLTDEGRTELERQVATWRAFSGAVESVLGNLPGGGGGHVPKPA